MRNPFARRPPAPVTPAVTTEQGADLRARARALIRPGFTARADAVTALLETFEDEVAVNRVVGEEWAERERELAGADSGDYGRVAAAFEALGRGGILARMSFTCCQTCGSDEIGGERTPLAAATPGRYPWAEWAYTFFHEQDAERLAEPDAVLFLSSVPSPRQPTPIRSTSPRVDRATSRRCSG